jgi:hypothetical protein
VSAAFRCEVCEAEPLWRILRRGDAVVSWACPEHLSQICDRLQRDWELTEVVVTNHAKAVEWSEIAKTLAGATKENTA